MRIVMLFIFAFAAMAHAIDLSALQQRLEGQRYFSASLTQQKTLKGWNKPITAKGLLACTAEDGVLYQLQFPVSASYWLQNTQISVRENQGPVKVMTFEQMPWLAGIATLLSASVSGDWHRLQQQFDLSLQQLNADRWQIDLQPKQSPLKEQLQQVQVQGSARIELIQIRDKKGDVTEIRLQEHQSLRSTEMHALLTKAGLR